jgi:hypothetical protein
MRLAQSRWKQIACLRSVSLSASYYWKQSTLTMARRYNASDGRAVGM